MEAAPQGIISELNDRSRQVFREIVSAYLEGGTPTGSRTLSRRLVDPLSPATIRNVMADLEDMGLLYAPHTSAGRLPTDAGLRLYVDGLLEVGDLTEDERASIEGPCAAAGKTVNEAISLATAEYDGLPAWAEDSETQTEWWVEARPSAACLPVTSGDGLTARSRSLPPSRPSSCRFGTRRPVATARCSSSPARWTTS